jgi:hypothetical protein
MGILEKLHRGRGGARKHGLKSTNLHYISLKPSPDAIE